jgi:hypothetical protein
MDEKLKALIIQSGNNLHTEVAQFLIDHKWQVDISSYYYDDTTDKPREIDLVAQKEIISHEPDLGESRFSVFLFIECKYFKEGVAFRMYPNQGQDGLSAIISGGMSVDILDRNNGNLWRNHHYVSTPYLAKLYDTKENNEVFNAITGTVKSLLFFKDNQHKKGLYYPLVIYSGIEGLYCINGNDISNLDELDPVKNVVFGLNYSYRNTNTSALNTRYFCVDFVNKDSLGEFLDSIGKTEVNEVKELSNFLLLKGRRL